MTKLPHRILPVASLFLLLVASSGCGGAGSSSNLTPTPPTPPPAPPSASGSADITSINHIIFTLQENRSFDQYFGRLNQYRATLGLPQNVDGIPPVQVDNLAPSPACANGTCSNPSYDPNAACSINRSSPIKAFNLRLGQSGTGVDGTVCIVNTSPSWDESHDDFNRCSPESNTPTLDGFVFSAARYALNNNTVGTKGTRAIGYYDEVVLNYYYFMASQFATSDRWFAPLMSRTQPNRIFALAASSFGHAYPPGGGFTGFTQPTIFQRLQDAGISWKVYLTDTTNYTAVYFPSFFGKSSSHFVQVSQYFTDLTNGELPQVAMIEPGSSSGLDEHPDENPQTGAKWVSSLINALISSSSWKDSVFLLSFDEAGGMFDHVPPQPAVPPDAIPPLDLFGHTCFQQPCGTFNRTGYRVPLIVVSPFTKKNYVSHTIADFTAMLKFIETRFNLSPLTQRDAAQFDMTEFFDFAHPPWITPPPFCSAGQTSGCIPAQNTDGVCNFNQPQ
jgi:phospholipase C